MKNTDSMNDLLSATFYSCALAGAMYDKEGKLIDLNRAMITAFSLSDKHDFVIDNLFDNVVLNAHQQDLLREGETVVCDEPVPFKVEMIHSDCDDSIGYSLWLLEQGKSEVDRENRLLMGQLAESRMLMRMALEDGKLAAYSFSFDRFQACDKKHCNRCFQFYGKTNTLLDKNRFICRALSSVRKPDDSLDFFYLFNKIHDEKLPGYNVIFHLKGQDGTYKMYEVTGKGADLDEEGVPYVILGSVIERNEHEHEEHQGAEALEMLKSTFLDNMSHEIRTPLNAIVGFSDMLEDEANPVTRKMYIDIIKGNNCALLELVNDLLEMSRIDANMVVWDFENIYLTPILNAVYEMAVSRVPEGVKLIVDAVPEVVIHSDKRKILQILVKLILNAARCTTKGEIHFGYKSLYPVSVQFYVTDTGRGIPHDKLGLIFDRFVQLDEFEQGVGLGLAICKGLVTGMGGSIWVTSEEGKGSSFSFKLPFECDRK